MEVWFRQAAPYYNVTSEPMPFPVPGSLWDRARGVQLYDKRMHFIRRLDELGSVDVDQALAGLELVACEVLPVVHQL